MMLAEVSVIPMAEEVPAVETNLDAKEVQEEEEDAEVAEVEEDDPPEIHTPGSDQI